MKIKSEEHLSHWCYSTQNTFHHQQNFKNSTHCWPIQATVYISLWKAKNNFVSKATSEIIVHQEFLKLILSQNSLAIWNTL